MSAFQDTREQTEQKVMVHLLTEIARNSSFTQRGLAAELGIALGLMNQYLKRCVTKGWIRASQVSARRMIYFLTPAGFTEKSLMLKDYLARSMTFFRDARIQCEEAFALCKENSYLTLLLVGAGDLADIAMLVSIGTGVKTQVVESDCCTILEQLKQYDAILLSDLHDPQGTYEVIKEKVEPHRLLILKLLHITENYLS